MSEPKRAKRFKFGWNENETPPPPAPADGVTLQGSTIRGLRVRDLGVPARPTVEYRCGLCIDDSAIKQVPLLATIYVTDRGVCVEVWGEIVRERPFGIVSGPRYGWTLWPMTEVRERLTGLCGHHPDRRFELSRSRLIGDARRYTGTVQPGGKAKAKSIAVLPIDQP